MSAEDQDALALAILDAVRDASGQMRLVTAEEIAEELRRRGFGECLATPSDAGPGLSVAAVLSGLPGVESLASVSGGVVYHDAALLSGGYARILDRKSAPAVMLAEEVRCNCRDYPRPVPVELFEKPPFDLDPKTVAATLAAMAAGDQYRDIASLATASGAVYLFSSLYLERGYALFLAEREASFVMDP